LGVRPKDGRDSFALWCDLAAIPQGWKRALMGHQAENVTQEYGWQESERILGDAEAKLRALLDRVAGQTAGQAATKVAKSNAPRRTRTPSLLIRSQSSGSTARKLEAEETEGKGTKPGEGPPKPAGHSGGQEP